MTTKSSSHSLSETLPDLATVYSELQALLITTSELDEFLSELAVLAVEVIPPVASCGITLRRHGEPMTVTSSDPLAARIDELQYGRGVGPCLEALHTRRTVTVTDLAEEQRWGDYPAHALVNGICASLSVPLTAGTPTVGAMNLYSLKPHEFTVAEVAQAASFAAQASGALALIERHATQIRLNGQLVEALASRAVIDQAMGVIMSQRHISATDAFDVLRVQSQQRNQKLRAVAGDLIESVTTHAPEPAPAFTRR